MDDQKLQYIEDQSPKPFWDFHYRWLFLVCIKICNIHTHLSYLLFYQYSFSRLSSFFFSHHKCMFLFCRKKISLYRGKQDGKSLAIYLKVADVSSLAQGWNIDAACTLTEVNQASPKKSVKKGALSHTLSFSETNFLLQNNE